jgi:hypothetical protein
MQPLVLLSMSPSQLTLYNRISYGILALAAAEIAQCVFGIPSTYQSMKL